ncbi:hyccin-like isoform X1 [Clavelina lepadiformis]|uniref:hyccin-like isoform X1 n=2 Tax=Clavelina lepadiformis TaxID=159417 RepID=UPI0040420B6A
MSIFLSEIRQRKTNSLIFFNFYSLIVFCVIFGPKCTYQMELKPPIPDEQVVREWLAEFKSLQDSSRPRYAKKLSEKTHVMLSLHGVLMSSNNETLTRLVQPSCHQLFEFYRSGFSEMKMFAIDMFPAMIGTYMQMCSSPDHETSLYKLSLGTYLLSIYNLVCDEKEKDNSNQEQLDSECGVEIPSIVYPSIYHDPMVHPFSEHTLNMPNPVRTYAHLPIATVETTIVPSNRCKILNVIMSSYCDHITSVSKYSLQQLCRVCVQISCIGFPWHQSILKTARSKNDRRIGLENNLCLTLLRAIYHALYNGCRVEATRAVQAVQKRATYEVSPQVLLLCNAIMNSVDHEKGKFSDDTPLGLTETLTPVMTRTSSKKVMRHAVTAQSIKHYKWQHTSEEVSGDFTLSLQQEESIAKEKHQSTLTTEHDENSKQHISPSQVNKSKFKKSMPSPSAHGSGAEKIMKNVATSASEKKSKKWLASTKSNEDERTRHRNPSGTSVEYRNSPNRKGSHRLSSTSVPSLKHFNIEEQTGLIHKDMERSNSLSKSASDAMNSKRRSAHEPLTGKLSESHSSPGHSFSKKGRGDKSKGKGESKDFLQQFRRSGSKKGKENKTGSVQDGPDSVPLLETTDPSRANNNLESSVTTKM